MGAPGGVFGAPWAATLGGRRASLYTWRTGAGSNTPSRWPATSCPEPPSFTTAPATKSPLAKWSGSDCNGLYRICLSTEALNKNTAAMASLITQRDFRAVQNLPFCYLCGQSFAPDDRINRDHVSPKSIFAGPDRSPLLLATHQHCNSAQKLTDEKVGQLIALKRGYMPSPPENRRLKFGRPMLVGLTAVTNLDVDEAVWRWIRGFHAALYREPLPPGRIVGAVQHRFPERGVQHVELCPTL
jgi:hypothetical protein